MVYAGYHSLLLFEIAIRLEIVEYRRYKKVVVLKNIYLTGIGSKITYIAIPLYDKDTKHLAFLQYGKPVGMTKNKMLYPFHCKHGQSIRLVAEGVVH